MYKYSAVINGDGEIYVGSGASHVRGMHPEKWTHLMLVWLKTLWWGNPGVTKTVQRGVIILI